LTNPSVPVHASRDRVLLSGDEYGDNEDGDEDEIFALKGLEMDEDQGEGDYTEDYEDEYVEGKGLPSPGTLKSKKKDKKKEKGKQTSSEDEEEEEETWGRGKTAYYSSNAAQLESDDEEGQEQEEQEARRLQRTALESMTDDDFGLNDKHDITGTNDPLECVHVP
jgi:U3 small nucleolar RNA-associated protein 3